MRLMDALAEVSLLKPVTGKLKKASLVLFEKADHSFKSGKQEFIPELANATKTWIDQLT